MSRWTHAICETCWNIRESNRIPVRVLESQIESETCCFCGEPTGGGIYVREDPASVLCRGERWGHAG